MKKCIYSDTFSSHRGKTDAFTLPYLGRKTDAFTWPSLLWHFSKCLLNLST